jgi:carotenoid cleavage dioxygenase-like enzyme
VLDRGGDGAGACWVGIEPCAVPHVVNAFDDQRAVVLDVCRADRAFDGAEDGPVLRSPPRLERWRLDPFAGRVEATPVDDRAVDFPRVDPLLAGRPYRHAYCLEVVGGPAAPGFGALVRYDLARGGSLDHRFGPGASPGEPIFVRAPDGQADDEGWVLTIVSHRSRDADLVILDASSFDGAPQAVVHLPAPVPSGLHGSWVPAADYR